MKTSSDYTCLAVIHVNSVLKNDENYYPKVFLKECKYIDKEAIRHITQGIVILTNNSFSFNKRLKRFHKRGKNFFPVNFLLLWTILQLETIKKSCSQH